ncbi:helix-turn-helix domain-containing protein [Granulosicoccus sp.]|jgi:transcriptional regulator with XRE-family HTH domain|nr:helix-turn-helix domain-containing protein [Granulosicoccus sp.]MDB4223143.1 helix-turn-helix domain-containing protein [Granulosicoccus sp.]
MITQDHPESAAHVLDNLTTDEFLSVVGQRVRRQRAEKSMSRKRLAEVSGVSERYLAQLESGQGNMSIALLRKVTTAIGMSMSSLMSAEITESQSDSKNTGSISLAPSAKSVASPADSSEADILVEI